MIKLLLVVASGGVFLALALQVRRVGVRPTLSALGWGLAWDDAGRAHALPAEMQYLLWLAHAAGLAYLWRLSGRTYPQAIALGLGSAAVLLLPQVPSLLRSRQLDVTPLSALFLPYLGALLWRLGLLPVVNGLAVLRLIALGAAGYTGLVQVQRFWRSRAGANLPPAVLALLVGGGGWVLLEYFGGRTQGVTGSDPYCYAQMAVDLARHGDPRHLFTLFPLIRDLDIPWWPIAHVGYYPPPATSGLSPTVWPVGWPVLLAAGYRLFGETALYVGAPVSGLLSLVVTALLAAELWPSTRLAHRWLGVALAVLVLATSKEQVLWLLVPMADVPAQLFSALAVWLASRAAGARSWPLAAASGIALGAAYDVRHTQVVLAPVVALALWGTDGRGLPWRRLLAAGAAACLAAAPDLWYHDLVFGSVWRPESPEFNLIGLQHWWGNARSTGSALASQPEFGLLLPFLAYGFWRLWRQGRRQALVLGSWILISAGTQFLYGPLRWRDLLSILPPLAILSAYGIATTLEWACRRERRAGWAAGWLALGVAVLLSLRSGPTLAWPLQTQEMIFGYLTVEQRQAFDLLGESVEPQAVVGTSLNSGPVELYTSRQTFRPGDWSPAELEVFLQAMAGAGKPIYILDDGNEHAAVVTRLRREGRLAPVRVLKVPLYGDRSRLSGMLYRVKP